jgi:hypothetical protein
VGDYTLIVGSVDLRTFLAVLRTSAVLAAAETSSVQVVMAKIRLISVPTGD